MGFMLPILFLLGIARAQFLSPPTGLTTTVGAAGITVRYKAVPAGTCELNPNVKSYSGYADIPNTNQSIFFWMFEARNVDPATAPMTIRLDGGPGASSMNGLFQEMGPCTIDSGGNVVNNAFSWSNISNVMFVDQPTQVGFSYSVPVPGFIDPNTGAINQLTTPACPGDPVKLQCGTYSLPDVKLTANTTSAAAPTFWKTIQGFMGAFPQYMSANNTVHIATESYGGHYGPIFASYIQSQNALIANKTAGLDTAKTINLKSLIIGDGFYDSKTQYPAYYNFTVSPGNTYDFSPYNSTLQTKLFNNLYGKGGCIDQQNACTSGPGASTSANNNVCAAADTFCVANVEEFFDDNVGRDEDDIREIAPDPFPPVFYYDYLNTPKLQAAIGASTNWSAASGTVFIAFNSTGDESRDGRTLIIPALKTLSEQGVNVVMYAGDADYDSNWLGGQEIASMAGATNFATAGFTNITTTDGIVHGVTKQAGLFSFSRIYEAGHEAIFYQPLVTYTLFERALKGTDVATGTVPVTAAFVSTGPPTSLLRQGNSTILRTLTPATATFNTTTGKPQLNAVEQAMKSRKRSGLTRRGLMAKFKRR